MPNLDPEVAEQINVAVHRRAMSDAVGALSKRLATIEATVRADAARKPDDDDKRSAKPDDDARKRDDAPVDMSEIAAMLKVILRHIAGEAGDEPEAEADDDDDARHARRARRRDDDDDKDLPAKTASDDADDDDRTATAQHRADSVAMLHGARADRPRIGEGSFSYRLRSARQLQRLLRDNDPLRHSDLRNVRDRHAFAEIEDKIYENAKAAAYDPTHNVSPGQLREVIEIDRAGRRISRWIGDVGVTMQPFRLDPMRLKKINTPQGYQYNEHRVIDGRSVR